MSDANRIKFSVVKETSYKTPPGSPTLIDLRLTGETIKHISQYAKSTEIESGRNVRDQVLLDVSAGGALNGLFSYGTYDPIFDGTFFSAWTAALTQAAGTSTTPTVSSGDLVLTLGSGSWPAFVVGSWVKVSGAVTTTAVNGYWKVKARSAGVLTLDYGTGTPTAGAAETTIAVTNGGDLTNGVDASSYFTEKHFQDQPSGKAFQQFPGTMWEGFALGVNAKQFVTISFQALASAGQRSATSIQTSGSHTAAPTGRVFNAVRNVKGLLRDGTTIRFSSFGANVKNNLRARSEVTQLGAVSIGAGDFDVEGTFQSYHEDSALDEAFTSDAETSFSIIFEQSANVGAYVLDLPRVVLTDNGNNATAKNTDVMYDMRFGAKMHETELITARLSRFP